MKQISERLYTNAVNLNHKNLLNCAEQAESAKVVDLGCDDGSLTVELARKIGTKNIFGVEIVDASAGKATAKGITVRKFDLNNKFSFEDNFFDVVIANQIIEHIFDSDNFLSEIHRILKLNGYAIISTENASSWSNIIASVFGWQIFSLTNFSSISQGIGNPFAIHKGESSIESWNHVRIYNIKGLKEYLEVFGLKVELIKGAGYFPLPSFIGNLDKTHCHFMTFKVRKV